MPKRGSESRVSKPEIASKAQKKSERSHEENQERAYIAASRRADRSIEARVQSARMASEIHKKRTGKSFRITEDIVIKEEMYEEEDDDFPRSYRLLGPHMQTGSAEMNSRLEAFLTNKIAMSQYVARGGERWEKENEINKLFAASFPNLDAQAKALSQSFSSPNYNSGATPRPGDDGAPNNNSHPQSPLSPVSPTFQHPPPPVSYHRNDSANSDLSPPALTPGSPTSRATPSFSMPGPMDFGGSSSAFTTELPNEARMMFAGMAGAPTAQDPYAQTSMFDPAMSMDWMGGVQQPQYYDPKLDRTDATAAMFNPAGSLQSPMQWDPTLAAGNAQANDDDWNDFINDQPWGETQAQ